MKPAWQSYRGVLRLATGCAILTLCLMIPSLGAQTRGAEPAQPRLGLQPPSDPLADTPAGQTAAEAKTPASPTLPAFPAVTRRPTREWLERIVNSASLLPPEMLVVSRLRMAEALAREAPEESLDLLRIAFSEAIQARDPHRWIAVDGAAPAANSLEGKRAAFLPRGIDRLSLQTHAIRIASTVHLDEALRLYRFLPRPTPEDPGCADFLLPDTSDRITILRDLGKLIWGFAPREEATQFYRKELLSMARGELAGLERVADLGPALWLLAAPHWSRAERDDLFAALLGAMGRMRPLPRLPLGVYREVHQRVLSAPIGRDPQHASLLADAWRDLMQQQLRYTPCETADGEPRDSEARQGLQRILDSNWQPAVGGLGDDMRFRRLSITLASLGGDLLDQDAVEGYRVTPIWRDDEGMTIRRQLRGLAPRPTLRVPMVTGPDGLPRPLPMPTPTAEAPTGQPSVMDWDALRDRFARYRLQQDDADPAAFHRLCDLWSSLVASQGNAPEAMEERIAWGKYLDGSPLKATHPVHWYQRAFLWLATVQSRHRDQVPLERFPTLQALTEATGFYAISPRGSAASQASTAPHVSAVPGVLPAP